MPAPRHSAGCALSPSRTEAFRHLHRRGAAFVIPNAWDSGSGRLLVQLGFPALATTSSGFAATLGQRDGSVGRRQMLAHAAALAAAVEVPVSADLENGYGDRPEDVAATVQAAVEAGLAGCSIEDWSGSAIYERHLAVERVAAAAEAAAGNLVLTARAESHLHGGTDLGDTIERLVAYRDAGAEVCYAPGLAAAGDISRLVTALAVPVNVLLLPASPALAELAALGVARVSLGGSLAFAALGGLARAAGELLAGGPLSFWDDAAAGRRLAATAFAGS